MESLALRLQITRRAAENPNKTKRHLENEPRPYLKRSRAIRLRGDYAELRASGGRVRSGEGRMVGDVESFKAQLKSCPFVYRESLQDRCVQLINSVLPQISEGGGKGSNVVLELIG